MDAFNGETIGEDGYVAGFRINHSRGCRIRAVWFCFCSNSNSLKRLFLRKLGFLSNVFLS